MKRTIFTLAILLIAFAAQTSFSQSKAQEVSTFLTNAKLLEKKPFDPAAKDVREQSFRWVIETDQVSVSMCSDVMKLLPEKKNKFKGELLLQMTFGMAVFKLENPDKKTDEVAASLAGIESMLRTYETMLAENPKAKNDELDALVAKRAAGTLAAVVEGAQCKSK